MVEEWRWEAGGELLNDAVGEGGNGEWTAPSREGETNMSEEVITEKRGRESRE